MVREMKTFAEAGVTTADTRGPVEI
jgi:hypothetical protein